MHPRAVINCLKKMEFFSRHMFFARGHEMWLFHNRPIDFRDRLNKTAAVEVTGSKGTAKIQDVQMVPTLQSGTENSGNKREIVGNLVQQDTIALRRGPTIFHRQSCRDHFFQNVPLIVAGSQTSSCIPASVVSGKVDLLIHVSPR